MNDPVIFSISDTEGDAEIRLTLEGFPSCCGAILIHGYSLLTDPVYRGTSKEKEEYHKRISKKFTDMLMAKGSSTIRNTGCKFVQRKSLPKKEGESIFSEVKTVDTDVTSYYVSCRLSVAKFIVMDAEWGENLGKHYLSLYKLCIYDDRWAYGDLAQNPNSDNKVRCFELTKPAG